MLNDMLDHIESCDMMITPALNLLRRYKHGDPVTLTIYGARQAMSMGEVGSLLRDAGCPAWDERADNTLKVPAAKKGFAMGILKKNGINAS